MSNRFHSKYHRHNHHTYTNVSNADAGHDPIASSASPFQGDFVVSGALSASAPLSGYAGSFYSTNTAVKVTSPQMALWADGNVHINGNLTVTGSSNLTSDNSPSISYTFNGGLLEFPAGTVKANLDNNTIKLNNDGKIYSDFTSIIAALSDSDLPLISYEFGNGLKSFAVGSPGSSQTIRVSSEVDGTSIKIDSSGRLALTKDYQISNGSGLKLDTITNNLSVNVDNDTIKVVNGVLKTGFSITNDSTAFTKDSNNTLKVKVDNSTIKISSNNELYSGLEYGSGLTKTGNSVGVKYSPSNFTTTSDGFLSSINVLRTDLINSPSRPQIIRGHSRYSQLIQATQGIQFADGSIINTARQSKPYVAGLGSQEYMSYSNAVYTSDNRVIRWGENNIIEGNSGVQSIWPPRVIAFQDNYNLKTSASIKKMKSGRYFHYVLFDDGTLWAQGWNNTNNLGLKTRPNPGAVYDYSFGQVNINEYVTDFEVGGDENDGTSIAAAITNYGRLYVWGYNFQGCLGLGHTNVVSTPTTPTLGGGNPSFFTSGVIQVQVSCADGRGKITILKDDGSVYAAGVNDYGQLGVDLPLGTHSNVFVRCHPSGTFQHFSPTGIPIAKIANLTNFTANYNTALISQSGKVYMAGLNNTFALANASSGHERVFWAIDSNILSNIEDVTSSGWSSYNSFIAKTTTGQLYSWGYNGYGQLGIGNTTNTRTPTLVPLPSDVYVSKLLTGPSYWSTQHSHGFITDTGDLYLAGDRVIGVGKSWTEVNNRFKLMPLSNVVEAVIGGNNGSMIIARDSSNRIFTWGGPPGHYVTGAANTWLGTIAEFTNFLV